MKRLAALIAGLFALSLVAAGGAGTNDYSSGFGYWGDPGGGASIGYEAIAVAPEGTLATGQFDYREASRTGQGQGFHGVIFCLHVEDDEAWFQMEMENGDIWEAHAVDGGDGNGGPRESDTFGLDKTVDMADPDCDRDDEDEQQQRINGNVVVQEGGFSNGS
ncbi:MAG: hypothetical protein KY469_15150 [Actinobacteria bacterium]|nr:hypothetical protein [Actinomycetota bacterium]